MKGESALFNEKTIKRLCSKTKVTAKQKKAARAWVEKLEADSLKRERVHYLEFNDYILRGLLGYDDVKFEEENVEFSVNDEAGNRVICFEVKGTETKDLFAKQIRAKKEHETPIKQLWDYMSKDATPFGIATNYRTFIIFDYSKGQSKYHQFDFLDIKDSEDKLKEFISIFSKKSVVEDRFVEKLYDESVIEEKEFTKEFYKLFHETRLMLIEEFKANEELADKVKTPIHFAQLYLNRLMFILFAEDTGKLLPRIFEDRILKILKSKELISEHSRYVSDTIRDLFVSVDKGATTPDKIFGFNGGLFEAPIPPKIYFKDKRDKKFFKDVYQHSQLKKEIKLDEFSQETLSQYGGQLNPLIRNLLLMASFDFNTEVNVNILGHIFEHSITDIEALQKGEASRRKKEGVYYTPEYITDYICRNTIIPYLSKKDAKTPRELVLERIDNIEELEKKFKEIKILDPACGSGAFLIKAVDVLLEIYKEIQLFKQDKGAYTAIKKGLKVKKDKGQLMLGRWVEEDEARNIIENNIFGVDINGESVEITKLSLFLKIARKNKKLINLSNNIKEGNSLIDEKIADENNEFIWEDNFPEIIKYDGNGKLEEVYGFDIIIGNPPYINVESQPKSHKDFYTNRYSTIHKRYDIFGIFFEKSMTELNNKGLVSFIVPSQIMNNLSYSKLRDLMLNNELVDEICYVGDKVFEDANNDVCIFKLNLERVSKIKLINALNFNDPSVTDVNIDYFEKFNNVMSISSGQSSDAIIDKLFNSDFRDVSDDFDVFQGIVTGNNNVYVFDGEKPPVESELVHPVVLGRDFNRYSMDRAQRWILYVTPDVEINAYPRALEYLSKFKDDLAHSKSSKEKSSDWYCIHRPRVKSNLDKIPKILVQGTRNPRLKRRVIATIDEIGVYGTQGVNFIVPKKEDDSLYYLLSILNSNVINYLYKTKFLNVAIKADYLKNTKIPNLSPNEQEPFVNKAKSMLKLKNDFYTKKDKFIRILKSNFRFDKTSKKIDSFYQLNFDDFKKELKKLSKKELSLQQQSELIDLFDGYKKELNSTLREAETIDKEIDGMVYKLFGLTGEEIKSVEEGSIK